MLTTALQKYLMTSRTVSKTDGAGNLLNKHSATLPGSTPMKKQGINNTLIECTALNTNSSYLLLGNTIFWLNWEGWDLVPQFCLDGSYFLFLLCLKKIKVLWRWNTRTEGKKGRQQPPTPFLIWKIQSWGGRGMALHSQQALIMLDHKQKFPQGSKVQKNFAFKPDRYGFKFWCCYLPSVK